MRLKRKERRAAPRPGSAAVPPEAESRAEVASKDKLNFRVSRELQKLPGADRSRDSADGPAGHLGRRGDRRRGILDGGACSSPGRWRMGGTGSVLLVDADLAATAALSPSDQVGGGTPGLFEVLVGAIELSKAVLSTTSRTFTSSRREGSTGRRWTRFRRIGCASSSTTWGRSTGW